MHRDNLNDPVGSSRQKNPTSGGALALDRSDHVARAGIRVCGQ
jgi:hypothetical protein